jgi:hypothetical protein
MRREALQVRVGHRSQRPLTDRGGHVRRACTIIIRRVASRGLAYPVERAFEPADRRRINAVSPRHVY